MSIDFHTIQWDKFPVLFELNYSINKIFYSNNNRVNSDFDCIQDISNSVDICIHSLQKKEEAHYCYNFNRDNIKKNAPSIHLNFNFIIESIIGQQSYEDQYKYTFVDYPNEYEHPNNLPFYIVLSPLKINKILQLWNEIDFFEEIGKIYLQPHLNTLNRIKNCSDFNEYVLTWINLLAQINKKPTNGLLIGW